MTTMHLPPALVHQPGAARRRHPAVRHGLAFALAGMLALLGCDRKAPADAASPPAAVSAASAAASAAAPSEPVPAASAAADAGSTAAQPAGPNLLSLASGAFLLRQPPSERAFDNRPINLIHDGQTWRSDSGQVGPQVFVIETPAETTLQRVVFDTRHMFYTTDENAREVLLEASNTAPDSGYQPLLDTRLPLESQLVSLPVPVALPARWFRLTIRSNHGSTEAVALQRVMGYGTQQAQAVPAGLRGTYRPVDPSSGKAVADQQNDLFVQQDGSLVRGCWRTQGRFDGGLAGTVANVTWELPELGSQAGLVVFASQGRLVFWRLKDGGFWALEEFTRVAAEPGRCAGDAAAPDRAGAELAERLDKERRALVYGINFDFDSDKLRPESVAVLEQIRAVLVRHPEWTLAIEGHTDDIGGAAYNLALSEKRARAVLAHLVQAGIAAERLSALGKGLATPVADNTSELGRARNRRVELARR
jgi:outer membrane protein OmpA-like peptidoglycan-associated protein